MTPKTPKRVLHPVPKTAPVRLKGKALTALRALCFERDEFSCQHITSEVYAMGERLVMRCLKPVVWGSGLPNSGHMAHLKSRGANGSDTLDNVSTRCARHHLVDMHNPKPVPSKPHSGGSE